MADDPRIRHVLTALHAEGLRLPPALEMEDDRQRLRALLTIRPPGALDPRAMDDLDALLRDEAAARAPVDHRLLCEPGGAERHLRLDNGTTVWLGDIRRLRIDAIVNAANDRMLGCFVPFHRCIDNAIHDAAGPRLREACALLMQRQGHPEATGTAKVTPAFNLPSRYVIHTVGPIVETQPTADHRRLLARCYQSCLDASAAHRIRSVAFCAISTGVFRYPREEAARVAVATVADWRAANPGVIQHVVFSVFDGVTFAAYTQAGAT